MNHKKTIEGYAGSMHELGEDIGNLDYDALVELFEILTKKFAKDAIHDGELNHPKVAKHLSSISQALQDILDQDMQPLADLCREYNRKGIR